MFFYTDGLWWHHSQQGGQQIFLKSYLLPHLTARQYVLLPSSVCATALLLHWVYNLHPRQLFVLPFSPLYSLYSLCCVSFFPGSINCIHSNKKMMNNPIQSESLIVVVVFFLYSFSPSLSLSSHLSKL